MYWCYACGRALRIISYPATDVFCPRCFGRFLHEIDPPPRPAPPLLLHPPGFFAPPQHFAPHYDAQHRRWVVYGSAGPGAAPTVPGRAFRQPAPSPAPAPPPRQRMPSPPPMARRRPSTPPAIDPGDYFTGGDMNLNSLVEELTQNDRPGPAPAAASAIDSLPTVRITATHMADGSQCPVCKEEFELGEAARELPCKHAYHSECIVPWLRLHNSCPICRQELPVPDGGTNGDGCGVERRGGEGEEPPEPGQVLAGWGPLAWLLLLGQMGADGLEHRHGGRERGEADADDAGGNGGSSAPTILQSFVLVAACFLFASFLL